MPLYLLQVSGFIAGATTAIYGGYYFLLDPVLQTRYKNLALLAEVEEQLYVDESKMTAELRELEVRKNMTLAKMNQLKANKK
jgi:hypothetical protein